MTNSIVFDSSLAQSLLEAVEEFPVDMEAAWVWLGYSKKQNAVDKLTKNFVEGVDYRLTEVRETKQDGTFSHIRHSIMLTVDCFKSMGMMAGTKKGKEVRTHFLNCEKRLKQIQLQPMTQMQMIAAMAQKMAEDEQLRLAQQRQLDKQAERQAAIEAQLAQWNDIKVAAHKDLIALPSSSHDIPPESTDMKIRRIVNSYSVTTGVPQSEAYRNLYMQHYYRYRRRPEPLARESKLQCFVRLGLIDSLYDLAMELFGVAA